MTGGTGPGLPLRAMLEHPSWREVTVLAGARAVDRPLTGTVVVPDLRAHPPELHGALLAIVLSDDRTDWRLDAVLARAAVAGAGAVLVAGTAPVRRSTQALAARLGLALLGAADPLAAQASLTSLLSEPRIVQADTVLRIVTACRLAGPSVEDVLDELGRVLHRPAALLDASASRIGGAPVLRDGEATQVVARLTARAVAPPGGVRTDLPGNAVLVAHPLAATNRTSWLAVRLSAAVPTEIDAVTAAVAVAAEAVRERLALSRLQLERDAHRRTSLLAELVRSPDAVPVSTRRRALDMGWHLDGWHTGIRIGPRREADLADLRADVEAALAAEHLAPVVVEQGDGWSVWTTAEREPTAVEVARHAAAVRRAQRRLADTVETYVGVGRVHAGPRGIAHSLAEAGDAARLAQNRAETGRFLHVDRLGLAQLLLAWTRTDTFQPAAQALLAPLDHEAGDLVRTLASYLDNESSVAETAAVLGVHRNTVASRVVRIQQLLGVDLSDADERLALHLACRTATPASAQAVQNRRSAL